MKLSCTWKICRSWSIQVIRSGTSALLLRALAAALTVDRKSCSSCLCPWSPRTSSPRRVVPHVSLQTCWITQADCVVVDDVDLRPQHMHVLGFIVLDAKAAAGRRLPRRSKHRRFQKSGHPGGDHTDPGNGLDPHPPKLSSWNWTKTGRNDPGAAAFNEVYFRT